MPVRPRKGISKRVGGKGITGPQLEGLILGYCFFEEPFKNDEERRKCWEKHLNFIMSLQGKPGKNEGMSFSPDKVYFDFGTRPAAWWVYDSPGPRLFVSCSNDFCPYFLGCSVAKGVPTEGPDCVIPRGEHHKGSSFDGFYKIESVSHNFKIFLPDIESEADFLQRHGLLNEAELEKRK